MKDTRRVLVTGGAGFIGSHLVEARIAAGDHVTVLDDLSSGRVTNLASVAEHPRFRFVRGDVVQPLAPQLDDGPGARGPTHIVHLAAQVSVAASMVDPLGDLEKNLVGTLRVIALAREAGARVVFASSAATYGDGEVPAHEGLVPMPTSPYGIHKLASEHHLRVAAEAHGVATTSLRFFNVYGPRQVPSSPYAGVISVFLAKALAGEALALNGGGVATRDFVYVGDLVAAIGAALERAPGRGEALNVGTASVTSIRDLARTILDVTGSASALVDAPPRAGDILHSRADVARIAEVLAWRGTTSLRDGLAATAAWVARERAVRTAPEVR